MTLLLVGVQRGLPLLLVVSTLAQYEEYEGFNHEGYNRAPVHHQAHQSLDHHGHGEEYDMDFHAHPKYSFDYAVKDPHTGDDKEHWETRDGDKVKGSYTLTETDGTKRVVEYEADDKNGFNAVVHRIGTPKHEEYTPKHEEYVPKVQEYHPKVQEYHPEVQEYHPKVQEYGPKVQEYHPKVQEYRPRAQEYHPKVQEYQEEEFHARPAHEPIAFNHDYGHFDEGFVPIVGYGRHE